MRKWMWVALAACLLGGLERLPLRCSADDPAPTRVDYEKQVQPILREKCLRCHNSKKQDGKLDLSSRAAMLKGGTSGPALVPGDAERSLMLELIEFGEMPPKNQQPRVTAEELATLTAWVAAGAPVPE